MPKINLTNGHSNTDGFDTLDAKISSPTVSTGSSDADKIDDLPTTNEELDFRTLIQAHAPLPIAHILLLDADGCALPSHRKEPVFTDVDFKLDAAYDQRYISIVANNLLELIEIIDQRTQQLLKVAGNNNFSQEVISFSARGDLNIDLLNARYNNNGCYMFALPKIAAMLQIKHDPSVLADCIGHNMYMGETFHNLMKYGYDAAHEIATKKISRADNDTSKVSNLYMSAHKKSLEYPNHLVILDVIDDKTTTLEAGAAFVNKNKARFPKNVLFRFTQFENNKAVIYYTTVQGTGIADNNYANTVKTMYHFMRQHKLVDNMLAEINYATVNAQINYADVLTKYNFFANLAARKIQYCFREYTASYLKARRDSAQNAARAKALCSANKVLFSTVPHPTPKLR